MSTAPQRLPTEAEYLAWEETQDQRYEFHHGEIYAMAGGTGNHSQLIFNVSGVLFQHQDKQACRSFSSEIKIYSRPGEIKYADVCIVQGKPLYLTAKQTVLLNPAVIIEVLSSSTEGYDRSEKFESYKSIASFEHYLLVHQERPVIEHFQRLPDGRWVHELFTNIEQVVRLPICGIQLPLQVVYQGIEFPPVEPLKLYPDTTGE